MWRFIKLGELWNILRFFCFFCVFSSFPFNNPFFGHSVFSVKPQTKKCWSTKKSSHPGCLGSLNGGLLSFPPSQVMTAMWMGQRDWRCQCRFSLRLMTKPWCGRWSTCSLGPLKSRTGPTPTAAWIQFNCASVCQCSSTLNGLLHTVCVVDWLIDLGCGPLTPLSHLGRIWQDEVRR